MTSSTTNCKYTKLAPAELGVGGAENHNKCFYGGCSLGRSISKLLVGLILLGVLLLFVDHFILKASMQNERQQLKTLPWQVHTRHGDPACLSATFEFQHALALQKQGIAEIKDENGQPDIRSTWTLIPRHFNDIWMDQLNKLQLLKLRSDEEEHKYFIEFTPNAPKPRLCNIITLGVGHSVIAERTLTAMHPECSFVAVDPAAEINENITRAIGGKFVHAAVGGETAEGQPVNYWGKDVHKNGGPERKMVKQIGIRDFLRNHTNGLPVDLLLIDIEGAEFGVLEQLTDHYDQLPVPICQLNMEVHHPRARVANYTHQRFFTFFDRMMRAGRFALMHTDLYSALYPRDLFLRLFLVNVREEVCTRKFLC